MIKSRANKTYKSFSDEQLVQAICSGNEEAAVYLIYNRYYRDLRYLSWDLLGSYDYVDDVCQEIYILLKGKQADWSPLKTWQGLSSFRTWLNRLAQYEILKKRKQMIGLRSDSLYSSEESESPEERIPAPHDSEKMLEKVLLVEAIGRIPNTDQKLVVLKELQGYSHREIADMLNSVRRQEGRIKLNAAGKEILADGAAVDVLKQRAMEFLKKELGHIRK